MPRQNRTYVYLIWVENDGTILPGGRNKRLHLGEQTQPLQSLEAVKRHVAALQSSSDDVGGRLLYSYTKNEVVG